MDCPGKLYFAVPHEGSNNFEIHLQNKIHRERVDRRIRIRVANSVEASQDASMSTADDLGPRYLRPKEIPRVSQESNTIRQSQAESGISQGLTSANSPEKHNLTTEETGYRGALFDYSMEPLEKINKFTDPVYATSRNLPYPLSDTFLKEYNLSESQRPYASRPSIQGVEQTFPNSRKKSPHLAARKNSPKQESINQRHLKGVASDDAVRETMDRHVLPVETQGIINYYDDDEGTELDGFESVHGPISPKQKPLIPLSADSLWNAPHSPPLHQPYRPHSPSQNDAHACRSPCNVIMSGSSRMANLKHHIRYSHQPAEATSTTYNTPLQTIENIIDLPVNDSSSNSATHLNAHNTLGSKAVPDMKSRKCRQSPSPDIDVVSSHRYSNFDSHSASKGNPFDSSISQSQQQPDRLKIGPVESNDPVHYHRQELGANIFSDRSYDLWNLNAYIDGSFKPWLFAVSQDGYVGRPRLPTCPPVSSCSESPLPNLPPPPPVSPTVGGDERISGDEHGTLPSPGLP